MTNKILLSTQVDVAQLVEDTIVTALEGGSNYWYWLHLDQNWFEVAKRYDIQLSKKETPVRTSALPLTQRIANALLNVEGFALPIYDLEDPNEKFGEITLESFKKACEICIEHFPNVWANLTTGNYDADDADIMLQLCVFGMVNFS
jgi:hypothetical protein